MKFVLSWTSRVGGSAADAAAAEKAGLQRLAAFQPSESATIHQWMNRVDGQGGFAVLEQDTAEDMLHDLAVWSDMFVFEVHPVVDVMEASAIQARALESRG